MLLLNIINLVKYDMTMLFYDRQQANMCVNLAYVGVFLSLALQGKKNWHTYSTCYISKIDQEST